MDYKNCIFSLSSTEIDKRELEVLTNGGIIYQFTTDILKLYLCKTFYIRMNRIVPESEETEISKTMELKNKLSQAIIKGFDPDLKKCIDNICEIFKEEKYLREYLSGLKLHITDGKLDVALLKVVLELYFLPSEKKIKILK